MHRRVARGILFATTGVACAGKSYAGSLEHNGLGPQPDSRPGMPKHSRVAEFLLALSSQSGFCGSFKTSSKRPVGNWNSNPADTGRATWDMSTIGVDSRRHSALLLKDTASWQHGAGTNPGGEARQVSMDDSGKRQLIVAAAFAAAAMTLVLGAHAGHAADMVVASSSPMDIALSDSAANVGLDAFRQNVEPPPLSAETIKAAAANIPEPVDDISDVVEIFQNSLRQALDGGKAGAGSAVINTVALTPLYTAMYYQRRYGGNVADALKVLNGEGGLARFYQGFLFGLVEGPVLKFGDVAANVGVLDLLTSLPATSWLPVAVRTGIAALSAGLWRIVCQPVDTCKVTLQVQGDAGWERLKSRIAKEGPGPLFQGSLATATYVVATDYPFFLVYNYLDAQLPLIASGDVGLALLRSAAVGVSASCVAGCVTNVFGIIKTMQQTAGSDASDGKDTLSIPEAAALVIETDGYAGLFGRGLDTKLLTCVVQGFFLGAFLQYFQSLQDGAR